jgi:hypothetical protein
LRGRTPAVRHRSSCAALTSTPRLPRQPIRSVSATLTGPRDMHPILEPRDLGAVVRQCRLAHWDRTTGQPRSDSSSR